MATRLTNLLQAKNGGNQSEMARYVGVTPQAVQKWLAGITEPRGKNLDLAAEFLGVTPAALKFGDVVEGSPVRAVHPDDPTSEGVVLVPESRIEFAAGNGRTPIYELAEDSEPATYRLSWFQREHINPDRVRRFRVHGDSQEPFLFHRDTVLVNLDEREIIDGKLYAIRYGDDLRIKFLYKRLDGTLILRSRNPDYPDEEITPELANQHISIIGRVRDKSGKGGL